jgi:hypothetical protein
MSWVDVGLLIVGLAAAAVGLYTGVLRVLMALAGLAAGLWAAWRFAPTISGALGRWLKLSDGGARLLAALLLLLATLGVAAGLTWLLTRSLKVFRLGWADRVAGALVALLLVACGAAFVAVNLGIDADGKTTLGGSRILPGLVSALERFEQLTGSSKPDPSQAAPGDARWLSGSQVRQGQA